MLKIHGRGTKSDLEVNQLREGDWRGNNNNKSLNTAGKNNIRKSWVWRKSWEEGVQQIVRSLKSIEWTNHKTRNLYKKEGAIKPTTGSICVDNCTLRAKGRARFNR